MGYGKRGGGKTRSNPFSASTSGTNRSKGGMSREMSATSHRGQNRAKGGYATKTAAKVSAKGLQRKAGY